MRCSLYFTVMAFIVLSRVTLAADKPSASDLPKCEPKRAVLQIDYSALEGGYPRVSWDGYVEFRFTVSSSGRAEKIVALANTTRWKEGETRARQVLSSALFDAPARSCIQSMRIAFKAR